MQQVASATLLQLNTVSVMQSILTGESSSVEKDLEPTQSRKAVYQDKTCLLFAVCQDPLNTWRAFHSTTQLGMTFREMLLSGMCD